MRTRSLIVIGLFLLPLGGCPHHAKPPVTPAKPTDPNTAGKGAPPVTPGDNTASATVKDPVALDAELMSALKGAGVAWDNGMGHSDLGVDQLECTVTQSTKTVACANPALTGPAAQALVTALQDRGIQGTDDNGHTVYRLRSVHCRSTRADIEGAKPTPDYCEVTP